jgi:hypothetical protein
MAARRFLVAAVAYSYKLKNAAAHLGRAQIALATIGPMNFIGQTPETTTRGDGDGSEKAR